MFTACSHMALTIPTSACSLTIPASGMEATQVEFFKKLLDLHYEDCRKLLESFQKSGDDSTLQPRGDAKSDMDAGHEKKTMI